jgi:restriction system protein
MGRRSGFSGLLIAAARDAARAQRQAEAHHRRQLREHERSLRQAERNRLLSAKEERQRYLEERLQDVQDQNASLADRIQELRTILEQTLAVDDTISFHSLRPHEEFPPFVVPKVLAEPYPEPVGQSFLAPIRTPNWFMNLFPSVKAKHQHALGEANEEYQAALKQHKAEEIEREAQIQKLRAHHEEENKAFRLKQDERNAEVNEFEGAYRNGDKEAIIAYNSMVLERSVYPESLPREFRVAYSAESKELVIEFDLPKPDVVPSVLEYKYVKARDAIDTKSRKQSEIKDLYQDMIAAIALRTIHEIFEADQGKHIQVATFSGFVQTVDPTTGRDVRPCLISVRTTRERFDEIDLSRVDKRACLRNLGAQVSPRPDERIAVKPIVEFNMVDHRFVPGSDVISELESRPNLMDLTPLEFEDLIGNLFSKMELETRQTQLSRDGGVDVVAFDKRPILGGKVVIQAKRYRHTVGVSAVRDLFGTMMNEGANKGILVTTSGYGAAAFNFVKDKPIELIDGGGLLYLLENHAGIRARIIMPEEDQVINNEQ